MRFVEKIASSLGVAGLPTGVYDFTLTCPQGSPLLANELVVSVCAVLQSPAFRARRYASRTSADVGSFDGRAVGWPLEGALVGACEDVGELHATVDVTSVAATMATLMCCKRFIAS
jgi:hypothetical protein